ncbi:hypothetical protein KU6B_35080 [Mameliella alba]|uniref:ABC transporter substrate-binding protein n=1 Tax=Mameliella alba TaxID=561184 RepID=UPI0013E51C41|nr:ABC transporter substrate-binding protein [Mameliella alba]BBU57243.1 hypothetical protein KU6B_35080 [Mameliella alba]
MTLTRRQFAGTGLALAATPFLGSGPLLAQGNRTKLTYATLKTGVSVIINENLKAKRPDLDNGLEIDITNEYTSVSSYYSDFISGTFELGIGAWDTYLRMHRKSVPAKMATTFTTGDMINIVSRQDGPSSVEGLHGKSLSGIAASGAFNMCKSAIANIYGMKLGKDVVVQNVPSPAQAMTLLMAQNVDAALSWEPNVSAAMAKIDTLRPIFNLGDEYHAATGKVLPYFGCAVRDEAIERDGDIAGKVHATFAQLMDQINADPMEAFTIAAPHLNLDPEVLMGAHEAGRLKFESYSMLADTGRDLIRQAQAFIDKDGAEIQDGFFAS